MCNLLTVSCRPTFNSTAGLVKMFCKDTVAPKAWMNKLFVLFLLFGNDDDQVC